MDDFMMDNHADYLGHRFHVDVEKVKQYLQEKGVDQVTGSTDELYLPGGRLRYAV